MGTSKYYPAIFRADDGDSHRGAEPLYGQKALMLLTFPPPSLTPASEIQPPPRQRLEEVNWFKKKVKTCFQSEEQTQEEVMQRRPGRSDGSSSWWGN